MRNCPRCGLDGDEASFYPGDDKQTWCRLCVKELVSRRNAKKLPQEERTERAQKAIRALVSQLQKDGQSFVYLIEGPGGYKIGVSRNISRRATQLNTALSHTCVIVAIAPGDRELERQLHHKHRFRKINREWFAQSPRIFKDFTKLKGAFVFTKGYLTSDTPSNTPALVEISEQT